MRALLAFDKFRDALSAAEACMTAHAALTRCHPDWRLDVCPLTDGGEGFAESLCTAVSGELRTVRVSGPRGRPVDACIGLVDSRRVPAPALAAIGSGRRDGTIALVGMAAASGLQLLPPHERDPWRTTTAGTGQLLRASVETGAIAVVLGVGGSATHDLGLGALVTLGLELRGECGRRVEAAAPEHWSAIRSLSGAPAPLPPVHIACDVANPLLGPRGAASVFGPQKGLRTGDVRRLDHETARLALLLCGHFGRPDTLMDAPGAGAAGGIAFGLMVAAQAKLVAGFELVSSWLDIPARIGAADVVLTGEGRFDESSWDGKGPGALIAQCRRLNRPVHVFAGAVSAADRKSGVSFHAVTPAAMPLEQALKATRGNLAESIVRALGNCSTA